SGDSAGFTMSNTNALLDRHANLVGGVLLTKTGAAQTWDYPNIHGDVLVTADASGTIVGPVRTYDPYGQPLAGLPGNSAGNMDYGWLGSAERPVDDASGIGIIQMGARPYLPSIGRFLSVDPVQGGSANDYDYCSGDPVNCSDLTGAYGYTKTYDIGPSSGPGSAEQLWQLVKDAPSLAFPFDVSGPIEEGSSLCVRPFLGVCESVQVFGVTDTSFSFKVLHGTFLPKGATITFSIRESEGRLIFRAVGRGPDTWTRWIPGFNQIVRPGIEWYLWGKMAYNLGGTRSALAQRLN
ncbi:MAG: RHS repeat-associated core domain-containing protein, partial [bacterium]